MRGHIRKKPSGSCEVVFDAGYVVKDGVRKRNRKFRHCRGREAGCGAEGRVASRRCERLFENPLRCPGTRLQFETFQMLVGDRKAKAKASDIPDFSHVSCLPYVDLMTLDGQMRSYVRSATRQGWPSDLTGKLVANVEEVLGRF